MPANINPSPRFLSPIHGLCFAGSLLLVSACGGDKGEELSTGLPYDERATTGAAPTEETVTLLTRAAVLNASELQRAAQTAPVGFDAGQALAKAAASSKVTAHRFYNTRTGAHFYTTSEAEKASVQANLKQFRYEGPAFFASGAAAPGLSPVHRFYNGQTGVHFYTISEDEKASVEANLPQFKYEGIAYYASKTAGTDLVALFRFYLRSKGYHFYSNSPSERDTIITTLPQYTFEGTGYYVLGAYWGQVSAVPIPHTGVMDQQCYQAGSDTLVPCNSVEAMALNSQQDGHRTAVHAMDYSEVPNPSGGHFERSECVKDNVTGLVWEGKEASGIRGADNTYNNYDDPTQPQTPEFSNPTQADIDAMTNSVGYVNYVNSIALCGYTDWRLPSVDELHRLVDYGNADPAARKMKALWFPNSPSATQQNYISHTPSMAGDSRQNWTVWFNHGTLDHSSFRGYQSSYLRLVRGGARSGAGCPSTPTAQRFAFNEAEVTDRTTGLVWARCGVGQTWTGTTCSGTTTPLTHDQALQLAQASDGWRLPNVKELVSITDKGCSYPAVDSGAFPNMLGTSYWTSSPRLTQENQPWVVSFDFGYASSGLRGSHTEAVRLVRVAP